MQKARLVLGVALLATLLVSSAYLLAPPRVEAEQSGFERAQKIQNQVRELSELQKKLVVEQKSLEDQIEGSMRDLDARQNRLKLERDELAAKQAELKRSFGRRAELQVKIETVSAEIQGLKSSAALGGSVTIRTPQHSLEPKLDQILNRLDMIEKRLDSLEKSAKNSQPSRTSPK